MGCFPGLREGPPDHGARPGLALERDEGTVSQFDWGHDIEFRQRMIGRHHANHLAREEGFRIEAAVVADEPHHESEIGRSRLHAFEHAREAADVEGDTKEDVRFRRFILAEPSVIVHLARSSELAQEPAPVLSVGGSNRHVPARIEGSGK